MTTPNLRKILRKLRRSSPAWIKILKTLGRGGAKNVVPERIWLRTKAERATVSSLGVSLEDGGWARVEDLADAVEKRYGTDLYLLLQEHLGFEPLSRAMLEERLQNFITPLMEAIPSAQQDFGISEDTGEPVEAWITACGDGLLAETRRRNDEQALHQAIRALVLLHTDRERGDSLALLAARALGDSHALDRHTPAIRYFLWALRFWKNKDTSPPRRMAVEEYDSLLHSKGLARSPLRSAVTVAGIVSGDAMMEGARRNGHVLTIPLYTLDRIGTISAAHSHVYVTENPNVLHEVVRRLLYAKLPGDQWPTLICGSGYGSLALWRSLDRLMATEGTVLFYSGDRDRDGILIEKMMGSRFPQRVKSWGDTRTSNVEEMAVDYLWAELIDHLSQIPSIPEHVKMDLQEAATLFAISDQ